MHKNKYVNLKNKQIGSLIIFAKLNSFILFFIEIHNKNKNFGTVYNKRENKYA